MVQAYSNVYWKNTTFETNLVFTRLFNFLGGKFAFQQTAFHYYSHEQENNQDLGFPKPRWKQRQA
jgi:hypothetical protein